MKVCEGIMEALTAKSILFDGQALSREEQHQIHSLMKANQTFTQVTQDLGRISCEVKRGRCDPGCKAGQTCVEEPERAQRSRNARQIPSRVGSKVVFSLRVQCCPEQKEQKLPLNHESVYLHAYAYKAKGGRLQKDLSTQNLRRRRCLRCGQTPHLLTISEHPMHIEASKQICQWLDVTVIVAGHQQAIVTLVGRKSGYAKQCNALNKRADLMIGHRLNPFGKRVMTLTVCKLDLNLL